MFLCPGHPHDLGPQSHLVQIRTNASYKASSFATFSSKDVRLRGHTEWLSDAIEVAVGAAETARGGTIAGSGNSRRFLRGKRRGKGRSRKARKAGQELGEADGEVEVQPGTQGERSMTIKSSVLNCAWWSRQ